MRDRMRIGRWLWGVLPIVVLLAVLSPLSVFSGGEVDLKQYISKEVVFVGETVTFGVGAIPVEGATVRWNFGDGSPEVDGWPVTHIYEKAGEYDITAVITYPSGETVPTIPTTIRVKSTGNTAPEARADVSPLETLAGMPITFDATGSFDPDGEITRYLWDFDDGTTATEAKVTHPYAKEGVYHAILTVTDDGEMDASAIVTVTVTALPTAILPGLDRAIPPPLGKSPPLPSLVLVDMGVWEEERFPYYEYSFTVEPPFRGVAASNRAWLVPDPTEFERESGTPVVMTERISVRNTSLLPRAHTNWGQITLVVDGRIVQIPVAVTVRGPAEDISTQVWSLYNDVLNYLTERRQRSTMVYTLRYPNGADLALGLVTEYVLTDGYDGELPREEFVAKVAEMLMDRDENGDGVIGFTDPDLGLGIKVER